MNFEFIIKTQLITVVNNRIVFLILKKRIWSICFDSWLIVNRFIQLFILNRFSRIGDNFVAIGHIFLFLCINLCHWWSADVCRIILGITLFYYSNLCFFNSLSLLLCGVDVFVYLPTQNIYFHCRMITHFFKEGMLGISNFHHIYTSSCLDPCR